MRKALKSASVSCNLKANDLTISFDILCEYWFDVTALEKLKGNESADKLIAVLSEYQGELLPGFYEDWVVLEREHINSIFEHNMARLMSLLQDEKRWLDILDWSERWIKFGQRPEPAYRALMSAHAAKGDMSKVVATYERCAKALKELGVEPSEQTRALYERLKAGTGFLETGATTPKKEKRIESPKTNLPTPLTSFIGRERELEEVIQTLEKNRIVTLTGSGGVGKTRLAIQAANSISANFKDSVWWAELAPLVDEALIPQAVAQALGVREFPTQPLPESLKNFLREKQLLLILDNCEHLIDACAQLAHDLLIQCANLRILATSREALDIIGEFEYQVQPLPLPAPGRLSLVDLLLDYESIRLFNERANAKSGFTLTKQNADAVFRICQRLDGIPLAIELAAAQTRALTVEQIAERLNDRFNLLTQGNRTALSRHQTLRASIDWSYDLLSKEEQALFRRLGVFVGGWALGGAKAVCSGDMVDENRIFNLLSSLVDKSLVIIQEQGGEVRYQMLETIREYAYERLSHSGKLKMVCLQHLRFFTEMVNEAEPNFKSREQAIWYHRLDNELGNLRVALTRCEGIENAELRLHFAAGLWRYWKNRGQIREGLGHLRYVLESTPSGSPRQTAAYARALTAAGSLAYYAADFHFSTQSRKEALTIFRNLDDKVGVADCLNGLGNTAISQGKYDSTQIFYEESLTIRKELGNQWGVARLLGNLGLLAYFQLDYAKAYSLDLESLGMFRELGDDESVANILINLGDVTRRQGDLPTAYSFYKQSEAISKKLKDQWGLAYAMLGLADIARERGDFSTASSIYRECLPMFQNGADYVGLPYALESVATLMIAINLPQKSARIFGVANAFRKNTNSPLPFPDSAAYQKNLTILQERLGQSEFELAWKEGHTMTMEEAIEYALIEST